MSNAINQLNGYLDIIIAIIVAVSLVLTVVFFVLRKKKVKIRLGSRSEDDEVTSDNAKYVSSTNFLGGEEIVDTDDGAIIVMEKDKRFLAMIGTSGSEFFSIDHKDKAYIIDSERARASMIDEQPLMIWQYQKPLDVKQIIENNREKLKKLERELVEKQADFEELKSVAKYVPDSDLDIYEKTLREERQELYALDFRRKVIDEQIDFMTKRSNNKNTAEQCICYVVEWQYDVTDFSDDLSSEEIWRQARQELAHIVREQISSLRESSVYAWRMSKAEVVSAIRQDTHPVYSNIYDIEKIFGSNVSEFVTSSDSFKIETGLADEEEKERQQFNSVIGQLMQSDRRKKELLNGNVTITLKCKKCGKKTRIPMNVGQYERYVRYLRGEGNIQDMLHDLTPENRELILSGLCDRCFWEVDEEQE